MAALNDLISQIEDEVLRSRIQAEIERLNRQKKFGLVFEEHVPEYTSLYEFPIEEGKKVILKSGNNRKIMAVKKIDGEVALCEFTDHTEISLQTSDLVRVAEFGEPIYPYLKPVDQIINAPDSELWHTLIEADNYHALQLLEYLYPSMMDCIYIDPPYNTGAKDWKYNNDYVDKNDAYRHSKWLSMMEKRLRLAKKLLKPDDSTLIVTIDEKECLHLGCLLEELFPDADIEMISTVTMPSGSSRDGRFGRAGEYIFYCFIGQSRVTPWKTDMLRDLPKKVIPVRWNGLIRNGEGSRRSRIPSLFYPILLDKNTGKLLSVGEPLPPNASVNDYVVPEGAVAMWPIDSSGRELMWRLYPPTLRDYFEKGFAKLGKRDPITGFRPVSYIQKGMIQKIESNQIKVLGKDDEGALILEYAEGGKTTAPLTIWNMVSHSAAESGSGILKKIIPDRHFPFPKSLYAVQDTLRFVVGNKPNALILDFFAGSGTTMHAVNLLNAEDSGNRRCILVTNNEVSEAESKTMMEKGLNPGDEEWEKMGIAHYITWPRTVCSIRGKDIHGNHISGDYFDSNKPISGGFKTNAAFLKLGFLDKQKVALGMQFRELLSILWMKTGCRGEMPQLESNELPNMLIFSKNHFAVLIDSKYSKKFIDSIEKQKEIDTVFIVTDSEMTYKNIISKIEIKESFQLYRDYLDNFRINSGKKLTNSKRG